MLYFYRNKSFFCVYDICSVWRVLEEWYIISWTRSSQYKLNLQLSKTGKVPLKDPAKNHVHTRVQTILAQVCTYFRMARCLEFIKMYNTFKIAVFRPTGWWTSYQNNALWHFFAFFSRERYLPDETWKKMSSPAVEQICFKCQKRFASFHRLTLLMVILWVIAVHLRRRTKSFNQCLFPANQFRGNMNEHKFTQLWLMTQDGREKMCVQVAEDSLISRRTWSHFRPWPAKQARQNFEGDIYRCQEAEPYHHGYKTGQQCAAKKEGFKEKNISIFSRFISPPGDKPPPLVSQAPTPYTHAKAQLPFSISRCFALKGNAQQNVAPTRSRYLFSNVSTAWFSFSLTWASKGYWNWPGGTCGPY